VTQDASILKDLTITAKTMRATLIAAGVYDAMFDVMQREVISESIERANTELNRRRYES